MKKLLSLLLAALLCVGAMTPVLAEAGDSLSSLFSNTNTATEAFTYTLAEYQVFFNTLSSSVLGADPTWETTAEGAVATIPGYGEVLVNTNADGYVTRLSTKMTVNLDDTEGASNLGMVVALVAMTSKATEDLEFLSANSDDYTTQLLNVLYSLMGNIADAMTAPITATDEVYGDTVTFILSISLTEMTMTLEFVYEP